MEPTLDRQGLADFLRRRREALQPADVGLAAGQRRRTPGLRREEVAALAHMSTDFYARLEQQRGSRPSPQTVAAVAGALRLKRDERDHLFRLAGHPAPLREHRSEHPNPALLRIMEQLEVPAQIVSDLGAVLAQNPLAEALLGRQTDLPGRRRNTIYRWFTELESRRVHPEADHEFHSRSYVANLRAVHGRNPADEETAALVAELRERSAEFARLWDQHEVGLRTALRKRVVHPTIGTITLDCQVLTAENQTERLIVFTAVPGSEDADRLRLLAVVGDQPFEAAADPEPAT